MENIDRAPWAESLTFTSFGVRIGIRVNQPSFRKSLAALLPPGHRASPSSSPDRLYSLVIDGSEREHGAPQLGSLYEDSQPLAKERELAPVLKFLEARIRRTVAEMAPRRIFVHAGVVEYRGRAIVIPGPSMSGKSTLVSELIRYGATYYSDEYAVLDDKGMVYPFAKPLSLRPRGSFEAIDYDAQHFGAVNGVKSAPIGLVLVTRYAAGARWRPRKLTPGHGALALLLHCVAARREPQRVITTLRQALGEAVILKGVRGEASELAQQLLERASEIGATESEVRNVNGKG
jgi:hypothetical protein